MSKSQKIFQNVEKLKIFQNVKKYLKNTSILQQFATDLKSIGLTNKAGYSVQELWKGTNLGHFSPSTVYNITLEKNDVAIFKATLDGITKNIY